MLRLAMTLYALIATTLAGSLVVAVLTMGFDTLWPIVGAAALGGLAAVPATWAVARALAG